jgi:glycerol-3-phosphate dehydrogenase (NAD(P)+)
MTNIGIVGTTGWATMLGILGARNGHRVRLWARTEDEALELDAARENWRLLPGAQFPENMSVTSSAAEALGDSEIAIVVVPSVTMRENLSKVRDVVPAGAAVVCATKGIEIDTGKRMSELMAEGLRVDRKRIGALSGPNLAPEIAAGKLSSATVAFPDHGLAEIVQRAFISDSFRVYTSDDVTGVELGGALKNIIAIGAGFIDGVDMGANAKAAFVTRGLHEITRLGVAMGAKPETFAGLAGMGDLIATCYSELSRNYRLGLSLAAGHSLEEALERLGRTAEGVPTTRAAVRLAQRMGVEMPIAETTHRVLSGELKPEAAARALMSRAPRPEVRY